MSELLSIASRLTIPIRIMIRPRGPPPDGRDFFYADDEIKQMLNEIRAFRVSGVMDPGRGDGFVFGALKRGVSGSRPGMGSISALEQLPETADRLYVDEESCRMLVDAAQPFPCVFHRAFDAIMTEHFSEDHWADGLASVISCGFRGILTAGGPGNCSDNIDTLTRLLRASERNLQIIAGGGLRSHNAANLTNRLIDHEGPHGIWMHTASLRPRDENGLSEDIYPGELSKILAAISLGK
ncbi:Copper homeostasis protein cutC -like protein [Escovopsis weberi]|uniref:Copper homeostasis protein cutC homolog n=1 Tax=Escovopsis weberi TaxID=150374 RepID=A0A0M8MT73_ESCWE|nr:Copper homeostasis protein cutC -like protein [Escovopsis weberi]